MKKLVAVLIPLLLLTSLAAAQPYVTVFEGRLAKGEELTVGDYTIAITQSANGDYYLMLKNGSRILELKPFIFGSEIERDGVRIILGSYTAQGGFIVVSVKPELVATLEPEVGARAVFDGNIVEVKAVGNRTVDVSINGVMRTLEINRSTVVDLIAVEYTGKTIRIYQAQPASRKPAMEYSIFYPYSRVKSSAPIDLPITVASSSEVELRLGLKVISLPEGWRVGFLYGGVEVEEITVPPKGTVTVTLHVEPRGKGVVKFSVGDYTGELEVEAVGIDVSMPYRSLEAEAGEVLTVPLTFTGSGLVSFKAENVPSGWEVYLTDGRYRLRSFEVSGSFAANLVIEVPRNATLGSHEVVFSINDRPYTFEVYVYKTYLGQPAKLTVILTDEGGNPIKGWIKVGDKNVTTSSTGSAVLELPAGEYRIIAGAPGALAKEESVKLGDGEERTLRITLSRAPYYFEIQLQKDVLTVNPGMSESTGITITNLGSNEDEYRISIEGLPEGWDYIVSQDPSGATPVAALKADPGESVTAYLVLVAPFTAQSGELNARVVVKGKETRAEKPITVKVESISELRLEPNYPTLTVKAGGSTATKIWVNAIGTVTNVRFTAQAPSGWEVEVVPETLPIVGSRPVEENTWVNEPQDVELRIRVPKSAPAGTYTITVTAVGDQVKAETVVTVRVTQSSSGAYIGVILLIAVFGIVIWLMRRVGRR